MKLVNLMMGVLSAGSLVLTGCPKDDPPIDETTGSTSTTGEPGTSTGEPATGTTAAQTTASSVDDTSSESTGAPEPWPEFDCTGVDQVLDGNVLIQSADDLAQLQGVREVTRSLVIDSTGLTDLDALGCIQVVGENLQIFGNVALTSVDGLVNVTEIRGSFIFTDNDALVDFDGLQQLGVVEGSFSMNRNDSMTQISGFDSLVGIEGDFTIRDNPTLLNIDGLQGLAVVGGVLAITANPMLCQSSVNAVGEGIEIPAVPPPEWSTNGNDNGC